jgi:hypothetical protein
MVPCRAVVYLAIELGFGVFGLLVGRLSVAVVPLLVWTVWGIGHAQRWWGNGGEQVLLGTVLLTLLGVLAATAGVGTRYLVGRVGQAARHARR